MASTGVEALVVDLWCSQLDLSVRLMTRRACCEPFRTPTERSTLLERALIV